MSLRIEHNTLHVTGDLDLINARQFFDDTPLNLKNVSVLDLTNVGKIDSIGLSLILYWQHRVNAEGGVAEINAAPDKLSELVALYDLGDITGK